MPKKVLMVAGRMHYGGLETVVMHLYRLIDREKISIDFMLNYTEKGAYDDEILSTGGKIYIMPRLEFKNAFRYVAAVYRFFKEHRGEYDIVHGHLTSVGCIYLTLAKLFGVKTTIIHAHYANTQNNFKGKIERLALFPVRFCADYYFACSDKAGRFCFGKSKLKKPNYRLIHNGIIIEDFLYQPKEREIMREKLRLGDAFTIIHIGRFQREKNHDFLLDIFREICRRDNNCVLLLAGNGPLYDTIKQKTKAYDLVDKVQFLGNRDDVHLLLQAADVFVLPSFYEGLPVVSAEAQAAGLPCVFSDAITKEADITGNCRFISLNDGASAWADALLSYRIVPQKKNFPRENTRDKIQKAGYDMKEQALWLQNFYLNGDEAK